MTGHYPGESADLGLDDGTTAPEGVPLPYDVEAEREALEGLVAEGSTARTELLAGLAREHFHGPRQRIYDVVSALSEEGATIGAWEVGARLRDTGRYAEAGEELLTVAHRIKAGALLGAAGAVPAAKLVARLEGLRARRELASSLLSLEVQARVGSASIVEVVEQAHAALARVQSSGQRSPIPMMGLDELARPLAPLPWVVEALGLAPGPPVVWAGYGYSRKTLAAQSLVLSIASGKPLFGIWRVRRGRAAHLDYEQGARLTAERYQRMARGMGFDLRDLPDGVLGVASMPRVHLDARGAELALLRACEGIDLVVVDSLRAACPSSDENSSEARAPLDMLLRVSERTKTCFVVVHHAKKPQNGVKDAAKHSMRGSSALFDACAGVFVFAGEKDAPTRVSHEKERNRGTCVDDFGLESEDVPRGDDPKWGLRITHLAEEELAEADPSRQRDAARAAEARTRVLEVVRQEGKASKRALRDAVGGNKNLTDRAIEELLKAGLIRTEGTGSGSGYVPH